MKNKIFLIALFLLTASSLENVAQPKTEEAREIENNDISHRNLYSKILSTGVKFPEVVFVQAIIESGNFTSRLFTSYNNLFGMKFPAKRETTSTGRSRSGYAKYEDWDDSVNDYHIWQNFVTKNRNYSRSEYLNLLGRIYAEDKSYISTIKRKLKEYDHIF